MGIKTRVRLLSKEDAVVYEEVNTALEGKIGVFMEVKSVDDSYNDAQMKELVQSVFFRKGHADKISESIRYLEVSERRIRRSASM